MSKSFSVIAVLTFMSCWGSLVLAQLPNTNLYLLDIADIVDERASQITLLSSFNPDGYNNQPHFISDHEILIASDHKAFGLTDIFRLNLHTRKVTRVTATEESEYSPTSRPGGDSFSVIRQELDDSTPVPQVLWTYPLDQDMGGELTVDLSNIGYHSWLTESEVALYLVDDPNQLVLYDVNEEKQTHIAYDVGRALKTTNDGELIYLHKIGSSWNIRKYDPRLDRSILLVRALEGQEDFTILPNGDLISSQGSTLYGVSVQPGSSREWIPIADLSSVGISSISRIAARGDKIVFVASAR